MSKRVLIHAHNVAAMNLSLCFFSTSCDWVKGLQSYIKSIIQSIDNNFSSSNTLII
jgi:hypothetical protein